MTGPAPQGSGSRTARTALYVGTRTLQAAISGILVVTLWRGHVGLAVNTALVLPIALLPDLLRRRRGYRLNAVLAFLLAASPFMHAVGSLGPYETVPWFDQVAHAVSAALVAGGGYVIVQVLDHESDAIAIPPKLRFAFVLIFAISFGVCWEILEFSTGLLARVIGGEPLLAQYGLDDVVMDLLFNTIGAVIVAVWGTRYFDGLRRIAQRRLDGSVDG